MFRIDIVIDKVNYLVQIQFKYVLESHMVECLIFFLISCEENNRQVIILCKLICPGYITFCTCYNCITQDKV